MRLTTAPVLSRQSGSPFPASPGLFIDVASILAEMLLNDIWASGMFGGEPTYIPLNTVPHDPCIVV